MCTVNGLIEIITANVTSWTMFLEGPILHSSEFLLQFAYVFCTCFNLQRVIFRDWIYSSSTGQRMDLRCSRNSLPVHWNGMLRNSRSHLPVQHQLPLNWIRCWWTWTQNWSLDSMATDWCRKWNFDDDLLGWCTGGHSNFTQDEESLCNILKACDNDCAGNLILILGLEMESIVFT